MRGLGQPEEELLHCMGIGEMKLRSGRSVVADLYGETLRQRFESGLVRNIVAQI